MSSDKSKIYQTSRRNTSKYQKPNTKVMHYKIYKKSINQKQAKTNVWKREIKEKRKGEKRSK